MVLPANSQQASAPWGVDAVVVCFGPEGGPYTVASAGAGLPVSIVAGSAANAAAGATGSAVPASADYVGLDIGGTLRGQTGVNPTGSVFAAQVDLASLGGTALSGTLPVSGTLTVEPGNTPNTTPWLIADTPVTSGGCSLYRTLDLQPTGQNVKASAGQLYGYYLSNQASSVRYVKFYNKATAPASTDTPVLTVALPANSAANASIPQGLAFGAGIGIRGTTGVADGDTGAPTANDIIANLWYV
jgi:hypothetical protein